MVTAEQAEENSTHDSKIYWIMCLLSGALLFSSNFGYIKPITRNTPDINIQIISGVVGTYILLLGIKTIFKKNALFGVSIILSYIYAIITTVYPEILGPFTKIISFETPVLLMGIAHAERWIEKKITQKFRKRLKLEITKNKSDFSFHKDTILTIEAGKNIPSDGVILEGETSVDESSLTGETVPISKKAGDIVLAGSINRLGQIRIRTLNDNTNTTIDQIDQIIESFLKSQDKNEIQWKKWKLYINLTIATIGIILSGIWLTLGSPISALISLITTLTLLSTNLFIVSYQGFKIAFAEKLYHSGIYIKQIKVLEKIMDINTIILAKAGVLAKNNPEVTVMLPKRTFNEKRFLIIAASLAQIATDVIGKAIHRYIQTLDIHPESLTKVTHLPGQGMIGFLDMQEFMMGNERLIQEFNIEIDQDLLEKSTLMQKNQKSVIYVIKDRKVCGIFGLDDEYNNTANEMLIQTRKRNKESYLVTSDNGTTTEALSEAYHIKKAFFGLIPPEKAIAIKNLQQEGKKVMYITNEIVETDALSQADISTTINTQYKLFNYSADVTLINANLSKIVTTFDISEELNEKIKTHIEYAAYFNLFAIPFCFGLTQFMIPITIHPVTGAAIAAIAQIHLLSKSLKTSEDINYDLRT